MPNISDCDLHIPHKGWSGDPHELENYLEIERWQRRFLANCVGGACNCGDTIQVIWSSHSSSSSAFRIQDNDTVDPLSYGYTGGTAISYSTGSNLFSFLSPGLYSARAKLKRLSGGAAGEANLFFLREDRTDNALSMYEASDTRTVANRAPGGWQIGLTVADYPVPSGSTWGLWVVQNPAAAFEVQAEVLITKTACCSIPPGPPPC